MQSTISELYVKDLDGNMFELTSPLIYNQNQPTQVTVPIGFLTDFASIPRVVKILFTGKEINNPASVVHDYLYTHHFYDDGQKITREQADNILHDIMTLTNSPKFSTKVIHFFVRLFGGSHWS